MERFTNRGRRQNCRNGSLDGGNAAGNAAEEAGGGAQSFQISEDEPERLTLFIWDY